MRSANARALPSSLERKYREMSTTREKTLRGFSEKRDTLPSASPHFPRYAISPGRWESDDRPVHEVVGKRNDFRPEHPRDRRACREGVAQQR